MVGGDPRDVVEGGPQRVALGGGAQRRRALRDGPEALGVVLVEDEVMRARLARRVDAAGAGLGDERDPAAGRDVHDVQRTAGLPREEQRAADRLDLGDRRARGEIVAHAPAPGAHRAGGERGRDRLALGVDGDGQAERGGAAHALVEREVVGARELRCPGVRHERLEADDAARGELVEAVDRAGYEAVPQREVDVRRPGRGGDLRVERAGVDRRRQGVERHVDDRRGPARRARAGPAREALGVGPAGVVEVDVGVDRAGEDVQTGRVDLFARRGVEGLGDGDDPPVRDADVGVHHAVGRDDRAAPDREGVVTHRRSVARPSTRRWATSIATVTSAAVTASAGLWLIPPSQRTKSIATSHRRAITAAS